jgi:hypothetical protein
MTKVFYVDITEEEDIFMCSSVSFPVHSTVQQYISQNVYIHVLHCHHFVCITAERTQSTEES